MTTAVDSKVTEEETDVTGGCTTMFIRLCLIYRVLDNVLTGSRNIDIIETLDNLFYYLQSHARKLEFEDGKLERVKLEFGAKLDRVYDNGIKDFRNCFIIQFSRFL